MHIFACRVNVKKLTRVVERNFLPFFRTLSLQRFYAPCDSTPIVVVKPPTIYSKLAKPPVSPPSLLHFPHVHLQTFASIGHIRRRHSGMVSLQLSSDGKNDSEPLGLVKNISIILEIIKIKKKGCTVFLIFGSRQKNLFDLLPDWKQSFPTQILVLLKKISFLNFFLSRSLVWSLFKQNDGPRRR